MRVAAQAKAGFYPCAVPVVAQVAGFLKPPKKGSYAILDPCAGEGVALQALAEGLNAQAGQLYACELDEVRAERLRLTLGDEAHVTAPASFFGVACPAKSLQLAWVNPPFDNEIGGGSRVELQFLERLSPLMAAGGVLLLVCPESVITRSDVQQHLLSRYERLSVWEFPAEHRKYDEVVCFGVRRKVLIDPYTVRWWGDVHYGEPQKPYEIPAGELPRWFTKIDFTPRELKQALAASPLRAQLEAPEELPTPRPPLALGKGHVALLLAAGQLDGLVCPDDEPPHVVRGVASKQEYVSSVEEDEDSEGNPRTKTVMSERIVLTVRAIGVDGVIRDFKQE